MKQPIKQAGQRLNQSSLGKAVDYPTVYSPNILLPIDRQLTRQHLAIKNAVPCYGYDYWNLYELSWLNLSGKPMVGIASLKIPSSSPYLIESKSVKLYAYSLNNERFPNKEAVIHTMLHDLEQCIQAAIVMDLQLLNEIKTMTLAPLSGICLDNLSLPGEIDKNPSIDPSLLTTTKREITESLHSHLFKSNCPVTGQPDWASIQIQYTGKTIDHTQLLKYIISYRHHQAFHESCIEKIFTDLSHYCQPKKLQIEARYTRRGGIDINPYRSSCPNSHATNQRLIRQ